MYDIAFPHLGIIIENLKSQINITDNFSIAYYGIIIGFGVIAAILVTWAEARRTGQSEDLYTDLAIWAVVCGLIGARLYYCIFQWSYYKDNPLEILNIRGGGLAIYGGVIGAVAALYFVTKRKGVKLLLALDTLFPGVILAQAIGRWGNFFNCEAFGRYTDSLFAMQIRKSLVGANMLGGDVLDHVLTIGGTEYIQVHPTFLYESVWNLLVFVFLQIMKKHKKFDGEITFLYAAGYGLGRMFIEGLRTDSLMIPGTPIRVSQAIAAICFLGGTTALIFGLKRAGKQEDSPQPEQ